MDDLYTAAMDYDELNMAIADRLTSGGSAVYAVMGGGCFSQLPCIWEACEKRGFELIELPGVPYYQAAFPEAQQGQVYAANGLPLTLDTDKPLYISELDNPLLAGEVKLKLQRFYPDDQSVTLAVQEPAGTYIRRTMPLYALDREKGFFASTVLFVPALPFDKKQTYGYEDLLAVLRRLRAPGGCPWDREQTHESLKKDLREECYELMDAIDEGSDEHIVEECGDLLMSVLFHPIIGEEQGRYDDRDVTTGPCGFQRGGAEELGRPEAEGEGTGYGDGHPQERAKKLSGLTSLREGAEEGAQDRLRLRHGAGRLLQDR